MGPTNMEYRTVTLALTSPRMRTKMPVAMLLDLTLFIFPMVVSKPSHTPLTTTTAMLLMLNTKVSHNTHQSQREDMDSQPQLTSPPQLQFTSQPLKNFIQIPLS